MLTITGKTLDVTSETVNGPRGAFESVTIHLLSGEGAHTAVTGVRVGRDFPSTALPRKDETVTLSVVVSAYAGKNGAGYRLTALDRIQAKQNA